jgi:hypothetical protein
VPPKPLFDTQNVFTSISDSIGTQHDVFHKSKLGKRLPTDDDMQKTCRHVVANLNRYTPLCNAAVSTPRHEEWLDCHTSTSSSLRHFHQ